MHRRQAYLHNVHSNFRPVKHEAPNVDDRAQKIKKHDNEHGKQITCSILEKVCIVKK